MILILGTGSAPGAPTFEDKGQSDGSSQTLFIDGVAFIGPVTDTAHSGQLRTGLRFRLNTDGDNFEAADLAAAGFAHSQAVVMG